MYILNGQFELIKNLEMEILLISLLSTGSENSLPIAPNSVCYFNFYKYLKNMLEKK